MGWIPPELNHKEEVLNGFKGQRMQLRRIIIHIPLAKRAGPKKQQQD